MKRYYVMLCFLMVLIFLVSNSLGQNTQRVKIIPCTKRPANIGKYRLLAASPGATESQFDVEIKPKYRTDANYLTIAKEFKEKYCNEKRFRIMYHPNKTHWLNSVDINDIQSTPLAIYFFTPNLDEKEGLVVYKVVNGKVESRKVALSK